METKHSILYLYAETSLHAGTGAGLGAVDLPIQREKHTNYPIIQASGVKGALRESMEHRLSKDEVKQIFGADAESRDITHAGAMSPSDARILCFPVRALNGVFVWVTSPVALARYQRETNLGGLPELGDLDSPIVSSGACLVGNELMLEEFAYTAGTHEIATLWAAHIADNIYPNTSYWNKRLKSHLVILPDSEFRDFVRYSTEIVTRIHLDDETKVVKDGQLFTQELLPADSILYSFVRFTGTREDKDAPDYDKSKTKDASQVYSQLTDTNNWIQIGADETVGRGRMIMSWVEVG